MSQVSSILKNRFNDAKTAINSGFSIAQFLQSKGIHVENNRQIRCPFHEDSTPSFSVDTQNNVWKCFGCPDGGHFLDLWIRYNQKYNEINYSIYLAVEEILKQNPTLQQELGFATIFKTDDMESSLFEKTEDGTYHFVGIELKPIELKPVSTDGLHKVLNKLKTEPPSVLISFIADCEKGMSDEQLFKKYYLHEDVIEDYISAILTGADEDCTSAFLEALNE